MTHLDALRVGWRAAALSDCGGSTAIHPSGRTPEEYEASGRRDAMDVLSVIPAEPDWQVMEFGCGNGRVTRHVAGAWGTLYAVDVAQEMLGQVQGLSLPNTTTALWDGLTPWPDDLAPLDAVFSHAVLVHNTIRDGKAILANLAAACRPGATLAIQVPVYEQRREASDWIDVTCWTPADMEAAARGARCTVEQAWVNSGAFSFDQIGGSHHRLHVLVRR